MDSKPSSQDEADLVRVASWETGLPSCVSRMGREGPLRAFGHGARLQAALAQCPAEGSGVQTVAQSPVPDRECQPLLQEVVLHRAHSLAGERVGFGYLLLSLFLLGRSRGSYLIARNFPTGLIHCLLTPHPFGVSHVTRCAIVKTRTGTRRSHATESRGGR